ncbi:competence/damage-inducible protein A [Trichothermofontia sichuanensis B231]|uniref:competence/damage-inducible protein A n=1 Tax=Trichothermofontia sichuanensis TaxID=3045816 RepID=UPI002246C9DF|nr:competence/damage-inducible protein A [Trichothermofontia sichuanensis]UZQ55138.1 competence/damage-inducible protein A [Trichothermofontia sichuanensis B231]
MSAEIICVGTELLLGDILNTNAQFLAQQLAQLGIPHYYQTVVGDNERRLQKVLATACERSRLLIFTGGLGPTPDDLTHATLAKFFDVPLVENPEILEDIRQKYAQRGRELTPGNRKQALIPQGADILTNEIGTAPGIIWQPRPGLTLLTFPGVPSELKPMWNQVAIPYLRSQGWGQEVIYSRVLKYWGIAESALAEKANAYLYLQNPTVAPYANHGEVKLRITARAASEAEAIALIAPVEQQLRQLGGMDYVGADAETLASVVGRFLQEAQETVAVAESCTGGGLGQRITTVPGSSAYFMGGILAYDNAVKTQLLGVDAERLAAEGAVSHVVAQQMAQGVQSLLQTTWGLSITGIAGPGGGTASKPVGLVYVGLAGPEGSIQSFEYQLGAQRDRDWIRNLSVNHALDRLRRSLLLRRQIGAS